MEIIVTGTLFDLLMHLLTIIDLVDETLDLMKLKTLKMTSANLKKKIDWR